MNEQVKLGDIKAIEFIGGQITKRIQAVEGGKIVGKVKTIPTKAIANGRIDSSLLVEMELSNEVDEKKLAKEGDVVVKLSTPYDAAYITKEDEGLLVTSFCIILRANDKFILPKYLVAFINSGVYAEQIKTMVSGATVPMLTIGKIKDVVIKKMEIDEQEQVAAYYNNIACQEITMKQIIDLEKEKLDSVLGGK